MMKRTYAILLSCFVVTIALVALPKVPRAISKARDTYQEVKANRPSAMSSCPDAAFVSPTDSGREQSARQVIVQPWEGRHNVYAIFVVPQGYQPSDFFVVKVSDSQLYCGQITEASDRVHDVSVQPGEQVVMGLLRTRTAMWVMAKGKQGYLEKPENWFIHLEKR